MRGNNGIYNGIYRMIKKYIFHTLSRVFVSWKSIVLDNLQIILIIFIFIKINFRIKLSFIVLEFFINYNFTLIFIYN